MKQFFLSSVVLFICIMPLDKVFAQGSVPIARLKPSPRNLTSAGVVFKLTGTAYAIGRSGKRKLANAGQIFSGDVINTDSSGHVEIKFADNTKLVVGPRSSIAVNDFVLNVGGKKPTASSFAIKAARGTFRFLSGNSAKSAYKISTKTATIGIRGTGFDFAYKGRTSLVLYNGSVEVCIGKSCALLKNRCDLAVEQGGKMFKSHSSQLPPGAYKLTFPYIRRENNLSKSYQLKAADCDSGAGAGSKSGISGGAGGGGRGGGGGGNTD